MLVIKKKGVIALIQRRNEIGFYNKNEKLVISIEYVFVMTHPRNVQSMGRRFVHILEESFTKEILIHV